MRESFVIEKAQPSDLEAILEVMRPWNMHHVPSPEMEGLDLSCFFVARIDGKTVGAAGYAILSQTVGKTTLMAVLPEYNGMGIGKALIEKRLEAMHRIGVKKVYTNSDRPESIDWMKRRYGYREVGTLKKVCSFGHPDIDQWTTLELDLKAHYAQADREAMAREYVARNEPHPLAPYPPLLINVCLTGMVPTKDMTRFVPLTPDEVVEDAVRAYDAGARIAHVHARDEKGEPTWRASIYEKILLGIRRERPAMICCISTSGRRWGEFEKRAEALELTGDAKPDMASLTLGSLNFAGEASVNTPEMIQLLAAAMQEKGILPELEAFDLGMLGYAKFLERKGLIGGRKYFNLLLGSLGSIPATIGNLASLIAALPEDSTWAAGGIGVFQLPMTAAAIVAGGAVRVGIEDSIFYDYGKAKLATNEELVRRAARLAEELGRPLATPAEAREMAGLDSAK